MCNYWSGKTVLWAFKSWVHVDFCKKKTKKKTALWWCPLLNALYKYNWVELNYWTFQEGVSGVSAPQH